MDEIMDWRTIARRLQNTPRGTRSRMAEALRMDRSQLARTLRQNGFPKADQLKVIESFLDAPEGAQVIQLPEREERLRVPLYGYAAAGGPGSERFAFNDGQILDWLELPRGMSLRGDFFIVQAIGSSMEPRIWPGERKLVQRNVPPGRDQDAVIEFHDGTAVLKTYRRERDGVVFAQQFNPEGEVRYAATDVKAIHAIFPL